MSKRSIAEKFTFTLFVPTFLEFTKMSKNPPVSLRVRCENVLADLARDAEIVDHEMLELLEAMMPPQALQVQVYRANRVNELKEQVAKLDAAQMMLDTAQDQLEKARASYEELRQANAAISHRLANDANLTPDELRDQIAARGVNILKASELEKEIELLRSAVDTHDRTLRECERAEDMLCETDLISPFIKNALQKVDAQRAELQAAIRKIEDRMSACKGVLSIDPNDETDKSEFIFRAFFDHSASNKDAAHQQAWARASSVYVSQPTGYQEPSVTTIDRSNLQEVQSKTIDILEPLVDAHNELLAQLSELNDQRDRIMLGA